MNPSHFYVRFLAEKREREILFKKINDGCCGDGCFFTSSDTVETGVCQYNSKVYMYGHNSDRWPDAVKKN